MQNKFLIFFFSFYLLTVTAKGQTANEYSRPVRQPSDLSTDEGTSLLDVYYGFPNFLSELIKTQISDLNSGSIPSNVTLTAKGPFGVRYEYLLTHRISLGGEFNYANSGLHWISNDNGTIYYYDIKVPRYRIMGKFNLHFGRTRRFDGYFSTGVGYAYHRLQISSNDPGFGSASVGDILLLPITMRLAVGGRIFFSDYIGGNFEFGLFGGPIFAVGLSSKF